MSARLRAGAHFIAVGAAATAENDEGYMTSVAFSPMLGHWIGLGVLARGPQRIGERVRACRSGAQRRRRGRDLQSGVLRSGGGAAPWLASRSERSALHGLALPGRYGASAGAAGLLIEERTDLSFASVIAKRGKRDALVSAVETAYGVALPKGPRRVTRGSVTFAGTGPDQWIASAEGPEAQNFAARVRGRIGLFAAVSDQTDARLVLRLCGPNVRDVLAKGVPLDLHPKVFKPGDVASTLVAYIGVQIDRLDDATFPAHRAAQHGGQFLVLALGLGGRVRL